LVSILLKIWWKGNGLLTIGKISRRVGGYCKALANGKAQREGEGFGCVMGGKSCLNQIPTPYRASSNSAIATNNLTNDSPDRVWRE